MSASQASTAPIPRGRRARERILRAALEVLADRGLAGFTMEAIAQRAGASRATLYRHWTSPDSLLVDAMDASFHPFPQPATGALRTDLLELLHRAESLLTTSPFSQLLAAFIDAAERQPALSELHQRLTELRREPALRALAAAQQRGELPASADLELAVDLLAAPAFYRRLIAHRPCPPGYAEAVVDHVLAGLRASATSEALIAGRRPDGSR